MLKAKITITFLIVSACLLVLAGCKKAAEERAEPAAEAVEAKAETPEVEAKTETPEVKAPELAEAEETMPSWSPPGLSTEGSEERMARMRERWQNMSEQQKERFRARVRRRKERWEKMSEEERQEYLARMRERQERWEKMSEEEKEESRARRRRRTEEREE